MNAPAAAATSAAPPSGPLLRDIHLPPAPSWWPPAPGWWGLAALLLVALAWAAWQWRRHRQRRRQVDRVLAEVDALAAQYARDGDHAALAAGLHQLLRRAARRLDPAAAQAQGPAWRRIVAAVPIDAPALETLLALETAMYRPRAAFDPAAGVEAVRRWLRAALSRKPGAVAAAPAEPTHG